MLYTDSEVPKTSPSFNSRIAKDEEEMCVYHFEILHLTVLVLQAFRNTANTPITTSRGCEAQIFILASNFIVAAKSVTEILQSENGHSPRMLILTTICEERGRSDLLVCMIVDTNQKGEV